MALIYQNPENGYTQSSSLPFLWSFLFGWMYFAVKGIWSHALISLVLAVITFGVSIFIYPFFTKGILENHYESKGWSKV